MGPQQSSDIVSKADAGLSTLAMGMRSKTVTRLCR